MFGIKLKYLLALVMTICFSQNLLSQEFASRDAFKINNLIQIGDTKNEVISRLGSPNSHQNDYNEFDEVPLLILKYGNSKIYLENDKVVAFAISDSSLSLNYNSTEISIGDNLSSLQSLFTESYNNRVEGEYGNGMIVRLKAISNSIEEVAIDDFINIQYNKTTNLITGIIYQSY